MAKFASRRIRAVIALRGFEIDQLRFLRGHSVSPCLRTRWVM